MSTDLAHLAGAPKAELARPTSRPGFLDGTRALFGGFGFVVRTPSVWPLALVPIAVGGLGTAILAGAGMHALMPAIARLFGPRLGFLATIVEVVVGALTLMVAAIVAFGLAQPLSGPALNGIVRRVDADLGAPPRPRTSAMQDVARSLQSIAIAYGVGLPVLAVLYLVTLLFPPASVVTVPLKLVVVGLSIAWDLCDYPLSLRGVPVRQRVALVGRNLRAMVGFGFGLGLLSLVPCAMILVLPAGVAGAARLARRIELFEDADRG